MKQTAICPGRYVQGEGSLGELGDELTRLGKTALIIAGGTAERSIIPPCLPACAEGETIHHEPCPISPEAVVAALKAADAFGRRRRRVRGDRH